MASETGDNVGNALISFAQKFGVTYELVTNNHQNISGSGTKWAQIFREKYIHHMLIDTYKHWQNAAERSLRDTTAL